MATQTKERPTNTVSPTIQVEFVLDSDQKPKFIDYEDRNGELRRHYSIRIELKSASEDTWSVTVFLHESYYDPVRELTGPNFAFETTTYGDYIIQAKVFGKKTVSVVSVNLADALKATYAGTPNVDILEAINKIAAN